MKSSRFSGEFCYSCKTAVCTPLCMHLTINSILGTPTEQEWPGVTSFPDFKASFPKWNRTDIATVVQNLDDQGLDLLDALLVYDPAGRISAKQAVIHPYFTEGSYVYPGRQPLTNGFH